MAAAASARVRSLAELIAEADTPAPEPVLILPAAHERSIAVAAECDGLQATRPAGVQRCRVISAGLVELTLTATTAKSGFSGRSWPFLVGGAGIGDEPSFALAFGGAPQSPLGVRFGVPISMHGVDDAGFCDASFWDGLPEPPTLRAVAERAVRWLSSPPGDGGEDDVRWQEAAEHTARKVRVVSTYRELGLGCAELTSEVPRLRAEWLAPALRPLLAEGGPPPPAAALLRATGVQEAAPGIFSFALFSTAFCELMLAEVGAFESTELPRRRPNTMNNGGLVINEIGVRMPLLATSARPPSHSLAPLAALLAARSPLLARAASVRGRLVQNHPITPHTRGHAHTRRGVTPGSDD